MIHFVRLRSTILLPLFFAILAVPSGSTCPEDADPKAGEVRGRVLDGATGSPVAGVPVSLLERSTVTDRSGRFRFSDVPVERDSHLNLRITDAGGEVIGCNTISVPVRFYPVAAAFGNQVDVAIVSPTEGREVELRVVEVEGAEVG